MHEEGVNAPSPALFTGRTRDFPRVVLSGFDHRDMDAHDSRLHPVIAAIEYPAGGPSTPVR